MLTQRLASLCHHFAAQQAGQDAIFFGHVVADGEAGALFPADGDLVLLDELADVLESHRGFVQFDAVMFGNGVDQVGGSD